MKTLKSFVLVAALVLSTVMVPVSTGQELVPPGTINFPGSAADQVLEIYRMIAQVELVTDSRVSEVRSAITLKTAESMTPQQVTGAIEKALLKQAGIVITHLDDKRVSVTYNDALPVSETNRQANP